MQRKKRDDKKSYQAKRYNQPNPHYNTGKIKDVLINILIFILAVGVIYLTYSFINRVFHKPVEITRTGTKDPIRIEVLNGCGINRLASRMTDFLRDQGFDVVKTDDASTIDYTHTVVRDRAGDIENANKVAYALGISTENITQQINEDLYLDVTVIIGLDYKSYKPFKK